MSYKTTGASYKLLETEVVITKLGIHYSVRGSGVTIWQLLIAGYSLAAIEMFFAEQYNVQISMELRAFVKELVVEDLLIETPSLAAILPQDLSWPAEYKEPSIEKVEDPSLWTVS